LLPVEHGPANGFSSDIWGNDDKVTYYTPRFQGFQAGVSYAPNLQNRGELTNRSQIGADNFQDIWEGGINYENQFDQIGVAAGVTGELGHSGSTDVVGGSNVNNIRAWNAGAKVAYMGFSVAGSYGDWSDSMSTIGSGGKAKYWTAGAAYETGPFGASITYLGSTTKPTGLDNKFSDVSVGADYKLAPGLTPFVEYTWYDLNPTGSASDAGFENKGNIFLVGSQISF
jgi:outer membrane protein OmpU